MADLVANEGEAFSLSLTNTFSDPENDAVSITVSGLPAWATFNAATRTITGTPGAGAVNQSHTITVTGSSKADSNGSASETFVLTINDAPDLTAGGGGNAIFSAGSGAVALDSAITLADAEGNFNGGTLRVQSSAPAAASGTGVAGGSDDDTISVTPQTVGGLVVALSGSNITVDGIVVGTIDATQNGSTDTTVGTDTTGKSLLITFNANATTARVQAVLQSLQFENTEATVVEENRSIEITLTDANGAAETFTTTVEAYNNQRPTSSDITLNVDEDTTLTLATTDFSTSFADGDGDSLLAVKITELPSSSQGVLQFNGSNISADTEIAIADIGAGKLKFIPAADFNGTVTFKFAVGDGKQFDDTPQTATVTVNPIDDAPRITSSSGRTTGVNVARAILIDPGLALVDPDNTDNAAGGTYADSGTGYLKIAITANHTAGDVLFINDGGTITLDGNNVEYNGTVIGTINAGMNGTANASNTDSALQIDLNNAASNDAVQALARAIKIRTSDRDSGSSAQKTITFTASDGDNANTVGATRTVDFSAAHFDNFDPSATRNVISSNGADDYINISGSTGSDFIDQSGAFTWEAWAKPLTGSGTLTLFSVGDVKDVSIIDTSFSNGSGISTSGTPSVTGGKLLLTPESGGSGSVTVGMPDAAKGAKEFTASFKMLIGDSAANASGDGMSFNYGSGTINGEEGVSNGLAITFDTYDNAGGDQFNTIAVYVDGQFIGSGTPSGGIRTEPSSHYAEFDGNDYVEANYEALELTGDMTFEAWFRPDDATPSSSQILVANAGPSGDGTASENFLFELVLLTDGRLKVFHESGTGADNDVYFDTKPFTSGQWSHIAISRDVSTNTYRLYVDGEFAESASYSTDPAGGDDSRLALGAEFGSGGFDSPEDFYTGDMDDVRIWNDVRTSNQIAANYDKVLDYTGSDLIVHYTFDDSLAADSSGSNRDLTNDGTNRIADPYGPQSAVEVPVDAVVHYDNGNYILNVTYDGEHVINNLNLGPNYDPGVNDVFSFGVRSGSANDKHQIDDLEIVANDAGTQHALAVVNGVLSLITETNEGATVTSSGVNVFSDGEFHHLAASYNNGTVKLYVDGELVHTATGIEKFVTQGNAVIGATSGDSQTDFWNGLIAEMRVWDSALSDDAIKNDYLPDIDDQSGLIGYWTFDGSSTSYTDQSGSGHTASYGGSSNWSQSAQTFFASPDSAGWTVVEGSDSGSTNDIAYIDPDTGELVVQNRELVRSADQHKPASTDPVHVTGTFKFSSGTDGFMHVMTRTDPSTTDGNGLPANGLNFSAVEGDDRILIDRFVNGSLTSVANSGNGSIDFRKDVEYSFDVYDDGSTVRLTVTEVGNPSNSVTITGTDNTDFTDDNYVVLTSREDTNSGGEQVVRFDDIQIDNDIVLDQDGNVDITIPTTGLTGPFTFKLLAQPEHGSISDFTDNSTDSTLTYSPTSGYHGQDTITVQVTDANGAINVHQISFNVEADLDVLVAGKQLEFDGTNDYVNFGRGASDGLAITGDITIEGWFKPNDTSTVQNFVYFGGDFTSNASSENTLYSVGINANGTLYANHRNGSGTDNLLNEASNGYDATAKVTFSEWNHVAAVRDTSAQTWKLYLNGELVQELSYANNPDGGESGELYFGSIEGNGSLAQQFSGQMDEIRIWSEARTDDDIRLNYDQQLTGSEDNLTAYYHFDDIVGDTIQDQTDNNHDGTLGADDTLGDAAEPDVVGNTSDNAPPVYGNMVDVAENTSTSGKMVYNETLSGTVSYAVDDGASGTTSFTTAKNGTVTIDANTGNWTYTPASNYSGSDSFTLVAKGATSGTDSETISVTVAGAGDENSVGMPDGVLQLDGNGDYVDLGSPSELAFGSDAFTVETWIRTGGTSNTRMNLLNLGSSGIANQGTYLFIENGKFSWDTYDSTDVVSTTTVNDQQWHHVAVVRDGTTIKVFVDGQLETTGTYTFTVPQAASTIGTNDGSSFNGEIDEFRIWSDARTDDEISANYQRQLAGNEDNLTAYYRFDDDPTATNIDNKATSTGSTLDATLGGDATVKNIPVHAADFSGGGNYIEVTNPSDVITGTGSFTYETWMKTDETTLNTIMGTGGVDGSGATMRINNGIIQFNNTDELAGTGEVFGTSNVADGLWHHVAVVYDSTTGMATVYVDGVAEAVGDAQVTGELNITAGNIVIGDANNHSGNNFGGQIANTRYWTTARSAEEIADNMNNVLTGNEDGLATQYLYDEKDSNGAFIDSAGTNNAAVTGTVDIINAAPTVQGTAGEIQENATLSGQMSANDVAGTPIYSVSVTGETTSNPDLDGRVTVETANGGTVIIDQSTGAWTYTPADNWYGTDSFDLTATGDNDTSDSETISVTVNNDVENSIVINDGVLDASGSGNSNYAQAPLGTGTVTNAMTMEMSVNFADIPSTDQYLAEIAETGTSGRFLAYINTDGKLVFVARGESDTPDVSLVTEFQPTTDTWYDLSFVFDNSTLKVYVDGELQAGTLSGSPAGADMDAGNESTLRINGSHSSVNAETKVLYDEIKIWSEARTHDQIRDGIDQPVASGTDNLEAYYKFDDQQSGTTVQDQSGNDRNLTLNGDVQIIDGLNGGLSFDGTDDVVTVANDTSLDSAQGTWSTWFKWDSTANPTEAAVLMSRHDATTSYNGLHISVEPDGDINVQGKDADSSNLDIIATNPGVIDGAWHQVTLVYDQAAGGLNKLYVDGELVATANSTAAWNWDGQDLLIGDSPDPFWTPWKGEIGPVQIYNTNLTDEQVATQFANDVDPATSGLVGYYDFTEGNGTTAANDATGGTQAPDATVSGATWIDLDNDTTATTLVIQEDEIATGHMLANDVPGTASYSVATDGQHGTVTMNADGTWSYKPVENYYGTDTFTLRVSSTFEGTTFTDDQTITVTINSVDDGDAVQISDGALSLDGTNDYVQIPDGALNADEGTISLRFNAGSGMDTGTPHYLFGNDEDPDGNRIYIYLEHDGSNWRVKARLDATDKIIDGGVVQEGQWYETATVWRTDGTGEFYVNGNSAGTLSGLTLNAGVQDSVAIGAYDEGSSGDQFFKGQIDEVAIWSSAQSAEDIRSRVGQQLTGEESDLTAYYRFDDDPDGNVVQDQSGNGNDGTLVNGADIVDPANGSEPTVLGNEIEIQTSETATGSMTGIDVPGTPAYSIVGGTTTFTTAKGGSVTIDATTGTWSYDPADGYYGSDSFTLRASSTSGGVNFTDDETVTVTIKSDTNVDAHDGVLHLDGAGDYAQVSHNAAYNMGANDSFTLELWANLNDMTSTHSLLDKAPFNSDPDGNDTSNYRLFVNGGNVAIWDGTNTFYASGFDNTTDVWTHIAVAYDGDNHQITFYQDGEQIGSPISGTLAGATNAGPLLIGRDNQGRFVDGMLDEVRVWDDLRSADEIRENYDQKIAGDSSNLVGYWNFDDTSGNTAQDSTTNNNDATLAGDAAVINTVGPSMSFDGTDAIVSVTGIDSELQNSSFTIELWANRAEANSLDMMLGIRGTPGDSAVTNDFLHFGYTNGTNMRFGFNGDDDNSTPNVLNYTDTGSVGEWVHWAASYDADSNVVRLYRNGELVATEVFSNDFNGSGTLQLGNSGVTSTHFYDGLLNDVRIWSGVRSGEEIAANYNTTLTGDQDGALLANYTFEETTGNGVTNTANSGTYDGTASGGYNRVDDSPNVFSNTLTMEENDVLQGNMNSSGADGSATFTADDANAHGTVTIDSSTGRWTYTPDENYHGNASFTLTATGTNGTVDTETISVTINADAARRSPVTNNGVLTLDGADDYITVSDNASLDLAGAFTIEAWVNLNDSSPLQNIVDKFGNNGPGGVGGADGVNYRLFVDNGHIGVFSIASGTVKTADGIVQSGEWTHISASFDGTNVTFYVNGEPVSDPQAFATDGVNAGNVTIGRDDIGRQVDGMIDDVRIWNDARTAEEIQANYDQVVATGDGLVGNWTFDASDGTTVADRSGNNNNGTLTSGAEVENLPHHAVSLDGDGDSVSLGAIGNLATGTGSFTHEIRFKTAGNSGTREDLISVGNTSLNQGTFLLIDTDGELKFDQSGNGGAIFSTGVVVTDNNWHHAAITYDSATGIKTLYLDGVALAVSTVGGPTLSSGTAVIGNAVQSGFSFNGLLADARFWNVARTADQIADNQEQTLTGTQTGLLASYPLNEQDGTAVHDATGSHDGSLVGDAAFVAIVPETYATSVAVFENNIAQGIMTTNDVVPANATFGVNSSGSHSGTTELDTGNGIVRIDADTGAWTFTPAENFNGQAQFFVTASGGGVTDAEQITVDVQPVSVVSNEINATAAVFDGTDDVLSATPAGMQVADGSFTMETWFNTSQTTSGMLLDLGREVADGALRLFLSNGQLALAKPNNVLATATEITVNDGQWHHSAVVYDGDANVLKLYVDGALIKSISGVSLDIQNGEIALGDYNPATAGTLPYDGQLGDVRLWSTARTATEVRENYTHKLAGSETGLEAYYTFDERDGTTVFDQTSNDNELQPESDSTNPSYSDGGLDLLANSIKIEEDTTASGTMTASDVVGTASYSVTAAAQHGTVSINSSTGEWTYTPNANYSGSDTFQLQATDGSFTDQETISISIDADNDSVIAQSLLQMDGSGTAATIAHNNALNATATGFTVEFWLQGTGNGAHTGLLDKMYQPNASTYNGWKFNLQADGSTPVLYLGDNDAYVAVAHSTNVDDGAWHHVSAVYDGTANTIEMYVDGVATGSPVSTAGLTQSQLASTVDLLIGNDDYASNPAYEGRMADLRIWNDARTAEEIQANYNHQLTGNEGNLVAYYTMESADGKTIEDKTSNNLDMTLTDSDGVNSVRIPGNAINLDGVDDHVDIGALSENISGAFTMEAWVKLDDLDGSWGRIFDIGQGSNDDNLLFAYAGSTKTLVLDTYIGSNGSGGSATRVEAVDALPVNEWVHLAAVNDGAGNAYIYVNGVRVASATGQNVAPDVARSSNYIGKSNFVGDGYLDGQIADARLWNVARSAEEIAANYDQQLTGDETGLVLNYTFEELDGTTVTDNTSNGNDGTANGGATIVDTLPEIQGTSLTLSTADTASGVMTADDVTGTATFSIETGPSHGTVKINADTGDWTYTPDDNYVGSDSFTLRATGATLGTDDETIALTVTGSPDATNAPTQSALQLDGIDDYVDIGPMSENISGAYTFEATVYYNPTAFDNNDQWMRIIDLGQGENDDNLLLAIDPTGDVLSFDTRNGTALSWIKSDTTVPTGEWIHVAGVNDGVGNAYLYINGELVKSDETGTQQIAKDEPRLNNYIGQSNWDGEIPMHGAVADVRIWNDARTADEIKANYNTALNGNEDSLVAYYTFEDITDGVVRDLTNNGNDAQVINNSADPGVAATGPTGDVLKLDGTNDYVRVAHDAALNPTTWTLESWFKTTAHGGTGPSDIGRIAAKSIGAENGISLHLIGGKLQAYTNGLSTNGIISTTTVNDGSWHHGAWTYDGTSMKLYVDGVLEVDINVTGTPNLAATNDFLIGAVDDGTNPLSQYFNGSIDNVRLWNSARSAEDIRDGMSTSYDFDTTNLVAQYTFDDVENSSTVLDSAHSMADGVRSDNNDGTLANGASIVDSGSGSGGAISHLDKAIHFDGTNDAVSDPSDTIGAEGNSERTIMLWARSSSEEPQTFVSYGDPNIDGGSFRFGLNGWDVDTNTHGGKGVTVDIGNGAITFQPLTGADDGQWHHYAVVLPSDGDSLRDLKVYQDGILLTTISALFDSSDAANSNGDIDIVTQPGALNLGHFNNTTFFNGDMAEVSIWSAGLTAAQISAYMNDQLTGGEDDLTAYWRGSDDGGNTPTVKDYAGSNDLTLANGASIIDVAPDMTGNSMRIGEDTIATGQVTTSGVNNSATYTVQTAAGHGTVTIDSATGVWNYQPSAGYSGTDTFTLRATGDIETEDEIISVHVGQDPVLPSSYSLTLDGTDDFIDVPLDAVNDMATTGGTIETWAYFDSVTSETIFAKQHDGSNTYALFSVGHTQDGSGGYDDSVDGKIFFQGSNSGDNLESTTTLQSGQWYHLAITFTNSEARLYVNGQLDKIQSGDFSVPDDTSSGTSPTARIGAWPGKAGEMDGRIADFRVWNDVRTADEIANSYGKQLNGDEQGLAGYWTFEEGAGNIAHDQSGNSNDATIVGGTHENMTSISMSAGATYKGLILGADMDSNDTLTYSTSHSDVTMDSDGSFEYTNTSNADDSFDVTITDSDGNQTIETIHIDIP